MGHNKSEDGVVNVSVSERGGHCRLGDTHAARGKQLEVDVVGHLAVEGVGRSIVVPHLVTHVAGRREQEPQGLLNFTYLGGVFRKAFVEVLAGLDVRVDELHKGRGRGCQKIK